MKKFICIIFVNVIVLLTMFMLANICIEQNIEKHSFVEFLNKINFLSERLTNFEISADGYPQEKNLVKYIEVNEENQNYFCGEHRLEYNIDKKENPIIILGCSYVYGHGLKKEDSFPNILSNKTGRPVYSYAACGDNAIDSIRKLTYNFNDEIKDADYAIYMYMYDHINRFLEIRKIYSFYEELFGKPKNVVHKFLLEKSAFYKFVCSSYQKYKILKNLPNTEEIESFLKKVIMATYKKMKSYAPNSKFIIIIYEEKIPNNRHPFEIVWAYRYIDSKIWKELEEETNGDIQIVRTKDVMGFYFDKDYKLKEDIADWHPNSRVWKEFTPKFVSQYIK